MKFKIDENLPAEAAVGDEDLSGADDDTVARRSQADDRVLVTLDLDFANIRAYPHGEHGGICCPSSGG